MTTLGNVSILALVMGVSWACDPPINVVVAEAGGAHEIDGGAEGGSNVTACKACLETPDEAGPGCGSEYTVCTANAECAAMIACTFAAGCYKGSPSLYVNCALPCAMEAGALSGMDPVLKLASPLFNCIVGGACTPSCFEAK
jgi:hypothetical protein